MKYRQQIALCLRRIVKRETLRVQEPLETTHNNVEATNSENLGSQTMLQTRKRKLESIYPMLDLASMPMDLKLHNVRPHRHNRDLCVNSLHEYLLF